MSRVPPAGIVPTLTQVQTIPDVPEIRLRLAQDTMALWEEMEQEIGNGDLPPPFWATAWAGGVALARYLLDNRNVVAGRDVLDVATGSGVVAIAAALAGARTVTACDIDEVAIAAATINAQLNGVHISTERCDVRQIRAPIGALVTAGDVFYERDIATAMGQALAEFQSAGAEVLVGDPHRSFLPFEALEPLASYDIVVDPAIETVTVKETMVARLVAVPEPISLQRNGRR
jgi:predicted nicotinamide N-methyase